MLLNHKCWLAERARKAVPSPSSCLVEDCCCGGGALPCWWLFLTTTSHALAERHLLLPSCLTPRAAAARRWLPPAPRPLLPAARRPPPLLLLLKQVDCFLGAPANFSSLLGSALPTTLSNKNQPLRLKLYRGYCTGNNERAILTY